MYIYHFYKVIYIHNCVRVCVLFRCIIYASNNISSINLKCQSTSKLKSRINTL